MKTLILLLLAIPGFSQTSMVRIKAGEDAAEILRQKVYIYPEFTRGVVRFRDGHISGGLMNYNMLVHEMHFISEKGDTLALSDAKTTRVITIGTDSFFYENFFFQQVAEGDGIKLVKRDRLKIVDKQKIGAYDMPTSNAAIQSYNSVNTGLSRVNINIREDVIMSKETLYFFGSRFNTFVPATRKSLIKLAGKKEREVAKYVDENNPDFTKEADLIKLVQSISIR